MFTKEKTKRMIKMITKSEAIANLQKMIDLIKNDKIEIENYYHDFDDAEKSYMFFDISICLSEKEN